MKPTHFKKKFSLLNQISLCIQYTSTHIFSYVISENEKVLIASCLSDFICEYLHFYWIFYEYEYLQLMLNVRTPWFLLLLSILMITVNWIKSHTCLFLPHENIHFLSEERNHNKNLKGTTKLAVSFSKTKKEKKSTSLVNFGSDFLT